MESRADVIELISSYLLFVFMLRDETGLDALLGLDEGTTLPRLSGVVGENTRQVDTREDADISEHL